MIRGIHHVALATADIDRLVDFYRDVLGFEIVSRSGWDRGSAEIDAIVGLKDSSARTGVLKADNLFVEVFQYLSPRGRPGGPGRPVCWLHPSVSRRRRHRGRLQPARRGGDALSLPIHRRRRGACARRTGAIPTATSPSSWRSSTRAPPCSSRRRG